MKVKDLDSCDECYCLKSMQINEALYEGGQLFEKYKNDLLRWRDLEVSGTTGGRKLREARLKSAQYEPIIAGIFDYLGSATLQEPIRIDCEGPEEKMEYYGDLNKGLNAFCQDRLLMSQLHKGSYIAIKFNETPEEVLDLETQKIAGYLDAKLVPIDATAVLNSECDESGNLIWAKVKTLRCEKDPIYGTTAHVHCWMILTKDSIQEFEYRQEMKEGVLETYDDNAEVSMVSSKPNPIGVVPLVKLELPTYIIDRLKPIAISLFNRAASVEYSLDSSAYQQGCFKGDREIAQISISESTMVHLKGDEDMFWRGPDSAHQVQLSDDCERLDRNLFKAIQAGSLRTASTDQNTSRLSGIARLREHGSIAVLLASYADALINALEKALAIIKKARGDEDVEIHVNGADRYDIMSFKDDLDAIERLFDMDIPDEAKKYITQELLAAFLAKAPAEVRRKVHEAIEKMDMKPKAPPPQLMPASPNPQENETKTGSPPKDSANMENEEK